MKTKTFHVGVFVRRGTRAWQFKAYVRDYSPGRAGCNVVRVEATSGTEAKRGAIEQIKARMNLPSPLAPYGVNIAAKGTTGTHDTNGEAHRTMRPDLTKDDFALVRTSLLRECRRGEEGVREACRACDWPAFHKACRYRKRCGRVLKKVQAQLGGSIQLFWRDRALKAEAKNRWHQSYVDATAAFLAESSNQSTIAEGCHALIQSHRNAVGAAERQGEL